MSFDFIIYKEDGSIWFIIECQGEQHYMPVRFAGMSVERAEKRFELQLIKDQIKRDFCKEEDMMLLEISYKNFKNIENILEEFIKSLNPN